MPFGPVDRDEQRLALFGQCPDHLPVEQKILDPPVMQQAIEPD
jgi:hypothetical protein